MSRGINKVFLLGHVGQDPDVRATQSGARIAKLSLATNRTYKDAAGTKREDVQWQRLTCFGRLADIVDQHVKKGDHIHVEGRIEYSESETDGQKRYWTDIVVNELTMLGASNGEAPPRNDPAQDPTGDDDYDSDRLPF